MIRSSEFGAFRVEGFLEGPENQYPLSDSVDNVLPILNIENWWAPLNKNR